MKKFIFVILLASVVTFTQAQISIGGSLGINLASQTDDFESADGGTTGSTLGFAFSIPVIIELNDALRVATGIGLLQKGSSFETTDSFELLGTTYTYESNGDTKLNYIEIPILVQYLFGDGDIRPYVAAGPSIGLGMSWNSSSELKSTTDDGSNVTTTTEDFSADGKFSDDDSGLNALDLAVAVGGGVYVPVGPGSLGLGLQYMIGLANVIDSEDYTVKNNGLGVNLSFIVPLN